VARSASPGDCYRGTVPQFQRLEFREWWSRFVDGVARVLSDDLCCRRVRPSVTARFGARMTLSNGRMIVTAVPSPHLIMMSAVAGALNVFRRRSAHWTVGGDGAGLPVVRRLSAAVPLLKSGLTCGLDA